jgi:hypothetical protein
MTYQPTNRFARLRRFAIGLLAASTVAFGSFALPASASAMPISCTIRFQAYMLVAKAYADVHAWVEEQLWLDKAQAVLDECYFNKL